MERYEYTVFVTARSGRDADKAYDAIIDAGNELEEKYNVQVEGLWQ